MRHLIVLGLTSVAFFLIAGVAYRYDVARYDTRVAETNLQLSRELLRFELSYLQAAQVLLQLVGDNHLLDEARAYEARRQALPTRDEQETLFQDLVTQIKSRLLLTMNQGMNESLAQEWRRANDQMQGALTRRSQVLAVIRSESSQP